MAHDGEDPAFDQSAPVMTALLRLKITPNAPANAAMGNSNDRQRCGNKSHNPRLDGNLIPFLVCAAPPL